MKLDSTGEEAVYIEWRLQMCMTNARVYSTRANTTPAAASNASSHRTILRSLFVAPISKTKLALHHEQRNRSHDSKHPPTLAVALTLAEGLRDEPVLPLAPFTRAIRATLAALAPPDRLSPRIVILSPGFPHRHYFEHSFLAQRMGATLVEGSDLVVSEDDRVFMRTIDGLEPVDVVYRRIDDLFLDPEVFRADSTLGVPGLMRAWKAGKVGIAKVVIRNKQHLAALRSHDGRLILETMYYADEIREPESVNGSTRLQKAEVDMAKVERDLLAVCDLVA